LKKVFEYLNNDREAFTKNKQNEAVSLVDPETKKVSLDLVNRVKCPICNVDNANWCFEKEGFDFVKCRHCGLLYVNPQLKTDVTESFYKNSKTAEAWIGLQKNKKEQEWNFINKYKPALECISKIKPKGGRLLDIGCSIGQFIYESKQYGWQPEGIELNHDAAEIARKEYGQTVYEEKLENLELAEKSYDLITLWGVLEHLTDPNDMLQKVYKYLKDDGLVLSFVPNAHSMIVRMTRNYNSTVSGLAHLWYFSPKTIDKFYIKNGFRKVMEFSVLPQVHEIQHFLQYNILYKEPNMLCDEELVFQEEERSVITNLINRNKMGYKLITIAKKVL